MNLEFVIRKRRKQPLQRDVEATNRLGVFMGRLDRIDQRIAEVTAERNARLAAVSKRYDTRLARYQAARPLAERKVRRIASSRWRSLLWHGRKTAQTPDGDVQYYRDPKGKIEITDEDLLLASLEEHDLDQLFVEWTPKFRLDVMHQNLEALEKLEGVTYHPPRTRIRIKTRTMTETAKRK